MNQTGMVSWKDYEGVEGFGVSSSQQIDELSKALNVGQDINAPGAVVAGDGFALRVESLEKTLKNTLFTMNHLNFFKSLPKLPAFNTVEEFNRLLGYGDNPDSGWIAEGGLPNEDDSSYERAYALVKYLGTTRKVSHQATLIKAAHGSVIGQETVNGTMHLLRIVEKALFEGNSDLSALQFDGYDKLIRDNSPATNVIDLRGLPLSEDILTDACLTAFDAPNYGTLSHIFMNPKVKADLVKTFFPKERHDTFSKPANGMVGLDLKGFTSPAGDVAFMPNVFVTDGGTAPAAVGPAATRPGTPTITAAATTPASGSSQFAADDAGNYYLYVQAVNAYGRSTPVDVGGAIAVVAGDEITFGVTPAAADDTLWFEVFRSAKNGTLANARRVLRVANSLAGAQSTINEYNAKIPGTTSAYGFQMNLECMSCKQLAPMVRIPLATVDTSIRWMQLIYLVPHLYTPGKVVLIENIGRAANYVGAA